jgi:ADP-heptose:LPS heptosyltransferase
MTHPVVPGRAGDTRGDRHEVDALYGFAELFGVHDPHPELTPQTYLAAEGAAQAAEWLAGLPTPRVALNVGASRAYKRWPAENWAALADGLAERGGGLIFIGDARDAQTVADVREWMHSAGSIRDLSGQTTLRQLASVLAASDLVVSGDSGPMHLAVAVGTPVLALFGATNPARHGPYGARHRVIQRAASTARGSHRPTEEEGVAAMRAITPADVLAAIDARFVKN